MNFKIYDSLYDPDTMNYIIVKITKEESDLYQIPKSLSVSPQAFII